MKYGVTIAYYGGASWVIAQLTRRLAAKDVPILEIRGCAYPEMAIAEQCRQALKAEVDVVVFIDSFIDVEPESVELMAKMALTSENLITSSHLDCGNTMSLCAVPTSIIRKMIEAEERRYSNTPVELIFSGVKSPAAPLGSPWNRDGSPLVGGLYMNSSEAFVERAMRVGARCLAHACGAKGSPPTIRRRLANADRPITHEPGSQFMLCVPSFGSLDLDQMGLVFALEKAGMAVAEIHNCPEIDQARGWLAGEALQAHRGAFFLDHDIMFHPNDMLRLCEQASESGVVVAGAYCMRKSGKNIIGSFDVPPGPITYFKNGSTLPAYYSGLGFAAVPHNILDGVAAKLPRLASVKLGHLKPIFALDCSTGFYAGEDVSFCNRVHDLTVETTVENGDIEWRMSHSGRPCRVFIDTRVRLAHRGSYDYGIEDAGLVVPRYESLDGKLTESREEAREMLLSVGDLPVEDLLDQTYGPATMRSVEAME